MFQVEATDEFDKWLKGLRDLQAKVRILDRIRRLRDGNPGDVKPAGKGVSEMRITHGPGYRLYTCSSANRSSFCCAAAIRLRKRRTSFVPSRWRSGGKHEAQDQEV